MNYQTKTLNYKYHIIWLCPCITSFATLSRFPHISWCSHQMDTFSVLLAICAGNSPVTGEFPMQRPVTRSFDVFFDLCLSKQWWVWWFEMPLHPLWRHCDLQTNRWLDWPWIWRANPLGWGWVVNFCWILTISWHLIGWAVSMDCSWIADEIDLKLGGWSH